MRTYDDDRVKTTMNWRLYLPPTPSFHISPALQHTSDDAPFMPELCEPV